MSIKITESQIIRDAKKIKTLPSLRSVKALKFKRNRDYNKFVKWIGSSSQALKKATPDKKEVKKIGTGIVGGGFLGIGGPPTGGGGGGGFLGGALATGGIVGGGLLTKKVLSNIKNLVRGGKKFTPPKRITLPKRSLLKNKSGINLKNLKNAKGGLRVSKGNVIVNTLAGGLDYTLRRGEGQTQTQAISGSVSGVAGGITGAALGGKIGAWVGGGIGAFFGGAGAIPGAAIGGTLGTFIGGWLGADTASKVSDNITGVGSPEKIKANATMFKNVVNNFSGVVTKFEKLDFAGYDMIMKEDKPKGLTRGAAGFIDYLTFGLTDLDKEGDTGNRFWKGEKPKGASKHLAGFADLMFLGLTDFDKSGSLSGGAQFDPIGGEVRSETIDRTKVLKNINTIMGSNNSTTILVPMDGSQVAPAGQSQIIPIPIGGGGSSSPAATGQEVSESQLLNTLWSTMLLNKLSK